MYSLTKTPRIGLSAGGSKLCCPTTIDVCSQSPCDTQPQPCGVCGVDGRAATTRLGPLLRGRVEDVAPVALACRSVALTGQAEGPMFAINEEHVMSKVRELLGFDGAARPAAARMSHGRREPRTVKLWVWRSWLSGLLAFVLLAGSIHIAAADSGKSLGPRVLVSADTISAQNVMPADADPTGWPTAHGQHGILCACSHAVSPSMSECPSRRDIIHVTYRALLDSPVASFAPPPLLRPPRV